MPLRDTAALEAWVARDDPRVSVFRSVAGWINGLDREPARAPSVPIPELSLQPEYEVRMALVAGVEIWYRQTYGELAATVDLIWVGSPGVEAPPQS